MKNNISIGKLSFLLTLIVECQPSDAQGSEIKPILISPNNTYASSQADSTFGVSESTSDLLPQQTQVLLDLDDLGDIEYDSPGEIKVQTEFDGEIKRYKLVGRSEDKHWYGETGHDELNLYQFDDGYSVMGSISREDGNVCDIVPVEIEHPNRRKLGKKKSEKKSGKKRKLHSISCRETNDFPPEADSPINEDEFGPFETTPFKNTSKEKSSLPKKPRKDAPRDYEKRKLVSDDYRNNLDVMVVWTKKAECANSNTKQDPSCKLDDSTESKMRARIALAIAESNTAFTYSGIETKLRLVHAYRDDNYSETTFQNALSHITHKTDGYMDDVHEKRETHGADIVAMIIHQSAYCGIGWIGKPKPRKDYMFSVTAWNCATGYYSFSHEIGHNMGCNHDRGTSRECSASGANYGYRDPQARFRSILAYDCASGQCDKNSGGGCRRVQRFSNNMYKFEDADIGNEENDNASVINNSAQEVSDFFEAKCLTDAECNDDDTDTSDWCNTNTGLCINGPTHAPTMTSTCPAGETSISIKVFTDRYPAETSWTLIDSCTDDTTPVMKGEGYTSQYEMYESAKCVPLSQYRFEIKDTYGDGLCCNYGNGWYSAEYDGTSVIATDSKIGEFGRQKIETFGTCDDSVTKVPSVSPTVRPSVSPTVRPSVSPSVGPSATPSVRPSKAPEPSSSPTIDEPSMEPTATPTKLPTLSPSAKPSKSLAPSSKPSLHPTEEPTKEPTTDPSTRPSNSPTIAPSQSPSTSFPSSSPSIGPSTIPSTTPTLTPSQSPSTSYPSSSPSISPSTRPSNTPTIAPSQSPSTSFPSSLPSSSPTKAPVITPTGPPPFQTITYDNFSRNPTNFRLSDSKNAKLHKDGWIKLKKNDFMEHKNDQIISQYTVFKVTFEFKMKFDRSTDKLHLQAVTASSTETLETYSIASASYKSEKTYRVTKQFSMGDGITKMKLKFLAESKKKEVFIDNVLFEGV